MLLFPFGTILVFGLSRVVGYAEYEDLSDDDTYEDYGETYKDVESATTSSYEDSTINRVRRYEQSILKTLGPDDVREVRGALKELLSGIAVENPFTPFTTAAYSDYRTIQSATISSQSSTGSSQSPITSSTGSATYETSLAPNTTYSTITSSYLSNLMTEIYQFTKSEPTRSKNRLMYNLVKLYRTPIKEHRRLFWNRSTSPKRTNSTAVNATTTTTTTTTFTMPRNLDIPRLLLIISKVANEFETNLTRKLHNVLTTMTLPTCTTPTAEPPVTSEYDANYTGSIIAKCFVCGLTIPRIPKHAHCADAFAGDFLPLVPVDPTAKGKISRFRKYCKYTNTPGFQFNTSEPRTIMGRWTGGCAVRWIDLSGIYTQRTCRNRRQPTMGLHFASKRMAKLERTLWNVENGCIISPMATLVPLSRGISLYARFHACVCTGSWCNYSSLRTPCKTFIVILSSLLFET